MAAINMNAILRKKEGQGSAGSACPYKHQTITKRPRVSESGRISGVLRPILVTDYTKYSKTLFSILPPTLNPNLNVWHAAAINQLDLAFILARLYALLHDFLLISLAVSLNLLY
jgi:hypothetical protein